MDSNSGPLVLKALTLSTVPQLVIKEYLQYFNA